MLTLQGKPAYSAFRTDAILARAREAVASVSRLTADELYFVDVERTLRPEEWEVLRSLLGGAEPVADVPAGIVVTPRLGTQSPWSTKATDILHHCGLDAVKRIERGLLYRFDPVPDKPALRSALAVSLHDRMTESVLTDARDAVALFREDAPRPLLRIALDDDGIAALTAANRRLGLALSADEILYLSEGYRSQNRVPTDVELMMFAQANSEHCRHKIFNASWRIDGQPREKSLFGMIRNTYACSPDGIKSAYRDNGAVLAGTMGRRFLSDPRTGVYGESDEAIDIVIKVETHNHPTAISPYSGAATGSGGEIRDEGATGHGAQPKAGLCGFSVSALRIPGHEQPWEHDHGKPGRIVSALSIMLEAPIGSAAFNNEFGRPCLTGYFRSFEQEISVPGGREIRGYHKPIMVAGGLGNIRPNHTGKRPIPPGAQVIVIGGPAMLIGLGGGAASSVVSGSSAEDLDFASVQRGNAEMQRRCQQVIDACLSLGEDNPILSIHDVGAGGLSNAVPELLADAGRGGRLELRAIPAAEAGLSPLELWCNEAQERYVLALMAEDLPAFEQLCARERCPMAAIGEATEEQRLILGDGLLDDTPVDLPTDFLLGKPPKMLRDVHHRALSHPEFQPGAMTLAEAARRVLRHPTVADKSFLITIGDRTVTGRVARDQMVGPWQVPVSDVAVTCADFAGYTGEAMAMGERTPVALINAAASARMAVGEAITNIAAADVAHIADIKLSANWMAACGHPGEDAALYEAVRALGEELCPALGIAIPVGKDSLSMKTVWQADDGPRAVISPMSAIISAFAPVRDVRRTLTPQLRTDVGDTDLVLIDLGHGRNRLGASILAQVLEQVGRHAPDVDDADVLKRFFSAMRELSEHHEVLAYHDRSDGGLFVTLCEMAFAGRCGLDLYLDGLGSDPWAVLFNEELGAVIQVRHQDTDAVLETLHEAGLGRHSYVIGTLADDDRLRFEMGGKGLIDEERVELHRIWSETSFHMQRLRDNPQCAQEAYDALLDSEDQGLVMAPAFDLSLDVAAPYIKSGRPKVAILREQGVNGHVEMAAAFTRAGFTAVDVHMTDLLEGRGDLREYVGLAACGGFSYGDVLGAGSGWAMTILHNARLKDQFQAFFQRPDVFALGVCNGCQMLSQLRDLIPGAAHWPRFVRNRSEQFEARLAMVEVLPTPSVLFAGMSGSRMPIAVAHGEGQALFDRGAPADVLRQALVPLRYVANDGKPAVRYPANPNGSPDGITALTSTDGRFTILMPHPERVFRAVQYSWRSPEMGPDGPWLRLFRNARAWVG